MNTAYRWLASILCATMLVLLASCATVDLPYIPTDSSVGNMSVEQARIMLVAAVRKNRYAGVGLHFTTNKVNVIEDGKVVKPLSIQIPVLYELPLISAYSGRIWATGKDGKDFKLIDIYGNESDIIRAANALYVLKQNSINAKKNSDEFDENFMRLLADYRKKATENASLPEEAVKFKVQAELAVQQKRFEDAVDLYEQALGVAPWWSAGHYNRGLILGEQQNYRQGILSLQKYLRLEPDAPDARAVQLKIYQWESLVPQAER